MSLDRESRVRLADLAKKASLAYPYMETFHVQGDGCLAITAFMQSVDPETVLALLADLDTAADLMKLALDEDTNWDEVEPFLHEFLAEHGDVS